jgi:hypothetical protein
MEVLVLVLASFRAVFDSLADTLHLEDLLLVTEFTLSDSDPLILLE